MAARMLVLPSEAYLDEVRAYREEFLAAGSSMDGTGALRRCEDPREWLSAVRAGDDPDRVPEGKVRATVFLCVEEGRVLGMIQLRHTLNEYLSKIKRSFRRYVLSADLLEQYVIAGHRGGPFGVHLSPDLVTLPRVFTQ